jgi:hypothetical protein
VDAQREINRSMMEKLLPELSMCVAIVMLAIDPGGLLAPEPHAIFLALAVEGASLMFFCTLIDVATRVRRRPPWWAIVAIVGFVFLMYPDLIDVLRLAWDAGLWVFLPLAWSLFERIRELWSLPGAPDAEKIRRRTLTFDRLWVGLVILAVAVACTLGIMLASENGSDAFGSPLLPVTVALAFYGAAAYNAWRVHRPAFAIKPTSLVPWLDRGDGTYLTPL